MKTLFVIAVLFAAALVGGCDHHDHGHDGAHGIEVGHHDDHGGNGHGEHEGGGHDDHHGHGNTDGPAEVVTSFTDSTELFVEFPALVKGSESAFAAHFSWLSDFTAVAEGSATVILSGGGAPEERFSVNAPSIPGIFRPIAIPTHVGERNVVVELRSGDVSDTHDLGTFTVFPSLEAAIAAAPEEEDDEGLISFLKEQAWKVDFGMARAERRSLRPSIRANATIRVRSDQDVRFSAHSTGSVVASEGTFPYVGMRVRRDQVLALLVPQLVVLRAPIDGEVVEVSVTPGTYVQPGTPLFRVVNDRRLWIEAHVPEADAARLKEPTGIWFEAAGLPEPFEVDVGSKGVRLVSVGKAIDPVTHSVPVIFEFPNPDARLRVGMHVKARVLDERVRQVVAVPREALMEIEGQDVIFVQRGGESFERRVVRVGIFDGPWVEIRTGVQPGEWVVTQGAFLVRLAGASGEAPAHGHAH